MLREPAAGAAFSLDKPSDDHLFTCDVVWFGVFIMRPSYRPHYTSYSSLRLSVPYGLITWNQKNVSKSKLL